MSIFEVLTETLQFTLREFVRDIVFLFVYCWRYRMSLLSARHMEQQAVPV